MFGAYSLLRMNWALNNNNNSLAKTSRQSIWFELIFALFATIAEQWAIKSKDSSRLDLGKLHGSSSYHATRKKMHKQQWPVQNSKSKYHWDLNRHEVVASA